MIISLMFFSIGYFCVFICVYIFITYRPLIGGISIIAKYVLS
jgi:hypothetical protein